jgi:hypothetical protein
MLLADYSASKGLSQDYSPRWLVCSAGYSHRLLTKLVEKSFGKPAPAENSAWSNNPRRRLLAESSASGKITQDSSTTQLVTTAVYPSRSPAKRW